MTATAIARLDMDIRSPESEPSRTDRIDLYAVGSADLTRYAALIVPAMADQEHLARHRDAIRDYLDAGGVVVFGATCTATGCPGPPPSSR